jgi:hypothetical protein
MLPSLIGDAIVAKLRSSEVIMLLRFAKEAPGLKDPRKAFKAWTTQTLQFLSLLTLEQTAGASDLASEIL